MNSTSDRLSARFRCSFQIKLHDLYEINLTTRTRDVASVDLSVSLWSDGKRMWFSVENNGRIASWVHLNAFPSISKRIVLWCSFCFLSFYYLGEKEKENLVKLEDNRQNWPHSSQRTCKLPKAFNFCIPPYVWALQLPPVTIIASSRIFCLNFTGSPSRIGNRAPPYPAILAD